MTKNKGFIQIHFKNLNETLCFKLLFYTYVNMNFGIIHIAILIFFKIAYESSWKIHLHNSFQKSETAVIPLPFTINFAYFPAGIFIMLKSLLFPSEKFTSQATAVE